MLRKSYSASGSEDEGDGASKYCNVCHTAIDVSQTFCANCGASNKHEGSLGSSNSSGQSGEVVVPGRWSLSFCLGSNRAFDIFFLCSSE